MSGICAVWNREASGATAMILSAVADGLTVSADEVTKVELSRRAGLGVRGGFDSQQTYRSERVILVCDADLLNSDELRKSAGDVPEAPSTAALLANMYDRHGEGFVEKLRGGFSVILLDLVEERLVAATDGFGIKRLAWAADARSIVIASRVDAVHAGINGLEINPRAIVNLLNFSAVLGPETILSGVHRLPPGQLLTVTDGGTRTRQYWDMSYGDARERDERRLARAMESVVEESVAAHCVGELPSRLGGFLSGGTDSSTVIGLMTRSQGAPVKAFSIGYQEEGFNELAYADMAARAFGAEHHTHLVSARDCAAALDDIVRCFDEPFGNSSAIATYFCTRLAAEHGVTTLLAGDGGDELFGGNERYATDKIFEVYHSIPKPLRVGLIEPLAALPIDAGVMQKARGYIRRAKMPGVERMLSFQFLRTHAATDVFDRDFLESLDGYTAADVPSRHYAIAPAASHLDRLLYVDMKITLADNDLPKVTGASELAGIRTRFPFLDRSVAEFSGRMPPRMKVKGFKKRYLFKKAFRDLLPAEILRKKKHGFGIPVALWMNSDARMRAVARDTLLSRRARERGYFRQGFVEELFRRHEVEGETYYGDILWTFLMLELWHLAFDKRARAVA